MSVHGDEVMFKQLTNLVSNVQSREGWFCLHQKRALDSTGQLLMNHRGTDLVFKLWIFMNSSLAAQPPPHITHPPVRGKRRKHPGVIQVGILLST